MNKKGLTRELIIKTALPIVIVFVLIIFVLRLTMFATPSRSL